APQCALIVLAKVFIFGTTNFVDHPGTKCKKFLLNYMKIQEAFWR
ncbi:MAG: hypothetical protein ACI9XJ_002239, partial [Marivirga sp.]